MNHSMAKVFDTIGKRTPVTARLSTIAGNLGNADCIRDLRGLAFKYALKNINCGAMSADLSPGCAQRKEFSTGYVTILA